MNIFQLLGISFLGLFCSVILFTRWHSRLSLRATVFWAGLALVGMVTIYHPELTKHVAQALGIHRGADFVFYMAILGAIIGFFYTFLSVRRIERGLTEIVRHIAIQEQRQGVTRNNGPSDGRERSQL